MEREREKVREWTALHTHAYMQIHAACNDKTYFAAPRNYIASMHKSGVGRDLRRRKEFTARILMSMLTNSHHLEAIISLRRAAATSAAGKSHGLFCP